MKYIVKGKDCIIFWLCIKGKPLWWNMLDMADPFEHMLEFFKKATTEKDSTMYMMLGVCKEMCDRLWDI